MVANSIGMLTLSELRPDHAYQMKHGASLCFLPMYHAYGQSMFITLLPHEHVPTYVMSSFDFVKMLSHIQTFRITILYGVPPIFVLMSKHPLARAVDFSSLDILGSGAAPLAANTKRDVDMLLPPGGAKLRQAWGMTEVTCSALAWDMTKPASSGVGELLPDCQAKLVDVNTGAEICKPYTQGELWISSPTIMRGYWRNPRATADTIITDQDGRRWLRTGDVAYAETYGPGAIFHIVDRFKELIKVNGFQVAPAELEALLLERDDVVEAAVVAVYNGARELPRAYLVRAPASTASGQEIAAWLAERVAPYKRLTGGVAFIDAVPKTPVRSPFPIHGSLSISLSLSLSLSQLAPVHMIRY
jgi:4-coumarate--CoA ligase